MRGLTRAAPLAMTAALLAVLFVTNAGSVPFFSGGPGHGPSSGLKQNQQSTTPGPPGTRPPKPAAGFLSFEVIGYVVGGACVLALLVFLVTSTLSNRRERRRLRVKEAEDSMEAFDALTVPLELLQTTQQQLRAIREGSPRNAIVACWWELERSSEATGFPRAAAETSSEFTERVLTRYSVDASTIQGLAALYREARFSDHTMSEEDRERAVTALEQILADLRRARSRTTQVVA